MTYSDTKKPISYKVDDNMNNNHDRQNKKALHIKEKIHSFFNNTQT